MKITFLFSSIVVGALCGAMPALAQNAPAADRAAARDDAQARPRLGEMERANKLIGKEVKASDDKRVGSVRDFAVDMRNGRVAEAIIGSGGVFGVDEKLRAVPVSDLVCDPSTKELRLNMDSARFDGAPSFAESDLRANLQRDHVVEVYKYYGASPYFGWNGQPVATQNPNEVAAVPTAPSSTLPGKPEGIETPGQNAPPTHAAETQKPAETTYSTTPHAVAQNTGPGKPEGIETTGEPAPSTHAAENQRPIETANPGDQGAVAQNGGSPKPEGIETPGQNQPAVHGSENQKPEETTATPYTTPGQSVAVNGNYGAIEFESAKAIMGKSVDNLQGDRIGKVENMIFDLPASRIVEVIVGSGGFVGMGGELSAVPPQSFRIKPDSDVMVLDTTKEALASAPHFKSSDWNNATSPDQVVLVYKTYNVQPYWESENTAANEPNSNLTPLKQGTSQSDMETTRQIRKAIMEANNLSTEAKNIQIITINGHVTLRGTVKSQEEKRRLGDIASTVTAATNIDNQLAVENGPRAGLD